MLRNYLAAALRNLARNRLYAAVNVVGLAVGFTAAILAILFVRDELSFDKWIPGHESIYRISPVITPPNRTPLLVDPSPWQTAGWLTADFREVEAATRLSHPQVMSVRRRPVEGNEKLYWADPNFLEVIPLPLVAGDRSQALQQPDGLVLTRSLARKYFGRDAPIGETLELVASFPNDVRTVRVLAVIEDLPSNSHLDIEMLGSSRAPFSAITFWEQNPEDGMNFVVRTHTYFRLAKGADAANLQAAMPAFIRRHKPGYSAANFGMLNMRIEPIADIHFAPGEQFMMKPRGSLAAVYGILAVGVLIVVIAVINFVNLTTARATRRSLEVGVRKAAGASRGALFMQFIGESLVYCVFGALAAVALAELALPYLNTFLQRDISFGYWRDLRLTGGIVLFVFVAAFCGGAYPALVLARLQPVQVLKGALTRASEAGIARAVLVGTQFCILIVLIIAATVVYRQTQYSMNAALRIDKDQVLYLEDACRPESFRYQVAALPGVRSVGCSSPDALNMDVFWTVVSNGSNPPVYVRNAPIDFGFFETYGITPVAGRTFQRQRGADRFPAQGHVPFAANVILNETAARRLGFKEPHQAIGQPVRTVLRRNNPPSAVIGVVPDFQFSSTRLAVDPTIYYIDYAATLTFHMNVKLAGQGVPETLQAIDAAWRTTGSPRVLRRQFIDEYVQSLYNSQERQSGLLAALSLVAVCIACLGLFGLTAFATERRTKEIGIRKAMGAGTRNIVQLLLWQFSRPVLLANLVAWPLAAWLMSRWLSGFAYHIALDPWFFATATALAVSLALATVSVHCILVARSKPIVALRHE